MEDLFSSQMPQNPSIFQVTGKGFVLMLYIVNTIHLGFTSIIILCEGEETMCSLSEKSKAVRFLLMVVW